MKIMIRRLIAYLFPPRQRSRLMINIDPVLLEEIFQMSARQSIPVDELVSKALQEAICWQESRERRQQLWSLLTAREREIASLVRQGYSNAEIAAQMVISPVTVKTHINRAARKFGLRSRKELEQALQDVDMF